MSTSGLGRSLVHGATWSLLANGSQAAIKVIATVVLARLLGPADMGVMLVVLSMVALLSIFTDVGLSSALARRLSEAPQEAAGTIAMTAWALGPMLLLASAVTFVFAGDLARVLGLPVEDDVITTYRWLVAPLLVSGVLFKFFTKAFEGLRRVDATGRIAVFVGWAPWLTAIALAALVAPLARYALQGKLIGEAVWVAVLAVALLTLVNRSNARLAPRVGTWQLLRYALPMVVTTAGVYVYTQSGVLVVQYFLDSTAVGLYGTAVRLVEVLHVPAAAVGAAVAATFVHLREHRPERSRDLYAFTVRALLIVYLPIGVGLWLVADALVPFVFGAPFAGSALIVQWYVPFLVFKALSAPASLALVYLGFAGKRALWVLLSALVNVVLMVVLVPWMGIVGAALATQLTYVPLALWYQVRLAREVGAPGVPPRTRRVVALVLVLGTLWAVGRIIVDVPPLVVGVSFAAAYAVGLLVLRAVTLEDARMLTTVRR